MDKYIKCIFLVNNQCIKLRLLINNTLLYIFSPPKWIPRFFLMVYRFSCFFVCHNLGFRRASCVFMYWSDDRYSRCRVVPIRSTVGRSQMWVIHSGELAKLVFVAILKSHLCKKYYHHRQYEHEVQGFLEMVETNLFVQLCE